MIKKNKSAVAAPKKRLPRNLEEWSIWMKRKGAGLFLSILRYALIICIGQIILMPILKMVSATFMSPNEVGNPVSTWIPSEFSIEHLVVAFKLLDYPKAVIYTIATTGLQMILQILSAAITGYSFARIRSKKIQKLFAIVILTIVVPPSVMTLPRYLFFRNFDIFGIIGLINGTGSGINLIGKPVSLYILAGTGMGLKSGLYIYFLRQAVRGLPISVEEAAFVDGAGFLRTFFTIVIPSMSGSILTVSVLSFLWNYTDTYYTSLLNPNTSHLAYNLSSLSGNIRWYITSAAQTNEAWLTAIDATNPFVQQAMISACSLLTVLPLLIMYAFVQKRFVQGAARSGLGGD